MIGVADPSDIVLIDKKSRSGKRLASDDLVQEVLDRIGSIHNVTLTRIAKHRRVLFVEGKDYSLLLKFASIAGYKDLSVGSELPSVSSDGFSNWTKIRDTAWGIKKILGGPFQMASMLDRDFRCGEEVEYVRSELQSEIDLAIILNRKEIENYLLVSSAICKAINAEIRRRAKKEDQKTCSDQEIVDQLIAITDPLENDVRSQYLASRTEYFSGSSDKRAPATLMKETGEWFQQQWDTVEGRIRVAPGKAVLARLREWAQIRFGVTLTTTSIARCLTREDLASDLLDILSQIDDFRLASLPDAAES
jgi:hypothetical protein